MIAYFIFNVTVTVVSVIGNLLVMFLLALNRRFHKMRHFLLASLALSDFIVTTLTLVPRMVSVEYKEWIFGKTLCHGSALVARVLYVNTFLHLCGVSYERYKAIVKDPLTYDGCITLKKVIICISVLWILPTMISLGPFFGWGAFEYKPVLYACGQRYDSETTVPFMIIFFIAPILFILLLNYKVIKVSRGLEREVNIGLGNMNWINEEKDAQKMYFDQSPNHNCRPQDEANVAARSQEEACQKTDQVIAGENAGQGSSALWKETLRKASQDSLADEDSKACASDWSSEHGNQGEKGNQSNHGNQGNQSNPGSQGIQGNQSNHGNQRWSDDSELSRNYPHMMNNEEGPEGTNQFCARATGEPTCAHLPPSPSSQFLADCRIGLVAILKECKAARDVIIIIGALLVCFIPFWIKNIYYNIKGGPQSSVVIVWVNSVYSLTTICNPFIYSIRNREFRKAVRRMFKT